jgi:hypothetical protein
MIIEKGMIDENNQNTSQDKTTTNRDKIKTLETNRQYPKNKSILSCLPTDKLLLLVLSPSFHLQSPNKKLLETGHLHNLQ